jgi:peroxiredoxin Q/BCP
MLNVGDTAPDFVLNDSKGKPVAFKEYAGKTLVMWFFPKADTPG